MFSFTLSNTLPILPVGSSSNDDIADDTPSEGIKFPTARIGAVIVFKSVSPISLSNIPPIASLSTLTGELPPSNIPPTVSISPLIGLLILLNKPSTVSIIPLKGAVATFETLSIILSPLNIPPIVSISPLIGFFNASPISP